MHAATNYTCAERARRAYNARISGHMTWRQDARTRSCDAFLYIVLVEGQRHPLDPSPPHSITGGGRANLTSFFFYVPFITT